ncbi:alpha/beta hydrolase [Sulfitobacter sp. EhC04]|uniref:alpha/beta hydrolase n=1 Tax=Sulfitobacter sp. EhC04 TaxID=1849168 RepID=UPI000AED4AFF|nr:alpha/beta hydrolase [Sulfitobacter sp. EhC04]
MSTPDYDQLIDAETWAYIARLDAAYPPDAVEMTIREQRHVYDQMCRIFDQGRPEGIVVRDMPYGAVPCRIYEKAATDVTVVYYHGGGFVVGGLDSHDDICAAICDRTGYRVISVEYSLAPEVVFPGCFNDAYAAFEAIAKVHPGPIMMAGDSAGGNLAAAVTHQARTGVPGRIVGQVLIYPGLGGDLGQGSYVEHANAPQLTAADLAFYHKVRVGDGAPPTDDPRFAPLCDTDFSGLPPSVLITAECDPLAGDGGAYRDKVLGAGGQAVWFNEPGMVHGCLRARGMSTRAAAFFDKVVDGIGALGRGEWPYANAPD